MFLFLSVVKWTTLKLCLIFHLRFPWMVGYGRPYFTPETLHSLNWWTIYQHSVWYSLLLTELAWGISIFSQNFLFNNYSVKSFQLIEIFYCYRLLLYKRRLFSIAFTFLCLLFYVNHAIYLSSGLFDYKYNLFANIIVGKFYLYNSLFYVHIIETRITIFCLFFRRNFVCCSSIKTRLSLSLKRWICSSVHFLELPARFLSHIPSSSTKDVWFIGGAPEGKLYII